MIEQIGHDDKNEDELYLINQLGSWIDQSKTSSGCLKSIDAINQGDTKGSKKWDKTLVNESGKKSQGEEKEKLGEDKQAD